MKANHQNENKSTEPSTHAITRRSFIKRTASAAVVSLLAIGAFENETRAQDGESESREPVAVMYTFKVGGAGQVEFRVPDNYVQGEGSKGTADAIMKAITDAIANDQLHRPEDNLLPAYTKQIFKEKTPITRLDDLLINEYSNSQALFEVIYKPDGKTVKSVKIKNAADGAEFGVVIRWARGVE